MVRLGLAFFASGFAALLCQVIWQRMLGLFTGSDTVSAALVVGAFLTGLGLGTILAASVADRLSRAQAILAFAACEVGVAVFAVLSKPFLYDGLALGMAGEVQGLWATFALCFAGLVLPTTLMGASLPLLSRAVATTVAGLAPRIALLYGLNTVGAGLGALLGGWLILGTLGFQNALYLAAAIELLAAGLALTLVPDMRRAPDPAAMPASQRTVEMPAGVGSVGLWCALAFASGFVIVALEIVWVRMIGQIGQYHAYMFASLLGVFLLADGLGMAVGGRLVERTRDPRPGFFLAQGAGFLVALVLLLAVWWTMPHWPGGADPTWPDSNRLQGLRLVAGMVLMLVLIAVPAFLIGLTFPFIQRAVQRDLAQVGARVGWVQLANILGNAAGSLGTGLVALHLLGTAGTLLLLAGVTAGLLLLWLGGAGRRSRAGWALLAAMVVGIMLVPGNDAWWRRLHVQAPGQSVAWAEDRSGVAFFRDDTGVPGRERHNPWSKDTSPFYIQGFSQGTIPFLPVHLLLGAVGPLVHPAPREVLVIGVGSGGTPWAAGVDPASRVRAVELVRPVLTALEDVGRQRPGSPMDVMFRDPRWRMEYGDGRRLVSQEERRYDVIEADAILPQSSQSGVLYSAEFARLVRARLAPGGLYVQWAPTPRSAETFAAVFEHAVMLRPARIMIGSRDPIPLDLAALLRRLAEPAVAEHLARGRPGCCDWAAMVGEPPLVWGPGDPRTDAPLTDLFPRDEFYLNVARSR